MTQQWARADRLVTVFGGSGFLGRHVVRALARRGWRIRVAVRRPDLAFHLQPLGKVGQIHAVQANLRFPDSVAHALRDADAAVNLVGILEEKGGQHFEAIHHQGAEAIAKAAKSAGLANLVHVSALGADAASPSHYAQTKAYGEAAVRQALPGAVILRPSVIFGPEDHFFNRFAAMARILPVLPLIAGETRLQPVFAGDVAEAVALALEGRAEAGKSYELGGPEVASLRQIQEFVLKVTGRHRRFIKVSFNEARLIASLCDLLSLISLGLLPGKFGLTRDQIELLRDDNIVSPEAEAEGRTLSGLGITPEPFETFVPTYLYRYRKTGQFGGITAA
ncbi:MAG TPA: complex I NDUFA9 subunit family protein [Methylocella sp.]|nr:complex I NDUFA9 subunit family protein [Methylocella sp.]